MGWSRYRTRRDEKDTTPRLRSWKALQLKDLKRLQKVLAKHHARVAEHQEELRRIEMENEAHAQQNRRTEFMRERLLKEQVEPLERKRRSLEEQLRKHTIAFFIPKFLSDSIDYNGERYRRQPGARLAAEHARTVSALKVARDSHDALRLIEMVRLPTAVPSDTRFSVGGARFRIDLDEIDSTELATLIESGQDKADSLRARASANERETRSQAKKFRRDLHRQLEVVPACPYCGGSLDESNAHLDHIYPVSKGGKSTSKNLVFVCVPCNRDKKTMTLRSFLKERGRSEVAVHTWLEALKKEF